VELNRETIEQLWAYHRLIHENNDDGDLTRLHSFPTIVERHYADCILPGAYVRRWPASMIDVGSGAGFPGIPLKIVHPEIRMTLCEPRKVRVEFLEMVIRKLGLQGIDVFGHKVTSNSMTLPVEGAVTRAFEHIAKTLPRLESAVGKGGQVYFLKGPAAQQELEDLEAAPVPGWRLHEQHWYTIPASTQDRSLIVMERIADRKILRVQDSAPDADISSEELD
jgi:16S rRNA (guanine527-N7)-methyltransferase